MSHQAQAHRSRAGTGRDESEGYEGGEDAEARHAGSSSGKKRLRLPQQRFGGVGEDLWSSSRSQSSNERGSRDQSSGDDSSIIQVIPGGGESSNEEELLAAPPAGPVPAPAILGGAVAGPIDTGVHTRRKVPQPRVALSITEKTIGSFMYEHLSNTAGDALLVAIKRPDFRAEGKK